MPVSTFVSTLYYIVAFGLAIYGFNALALAFVFLFKRFGRVIHAPPEQASLAEGDEWPLVTVQLPLYNERYVCERLLNAVAAFDYPSDKLIVQLLDDSTDQTTQLLQKLAPAFREKGLNIQHVRRETRSGYKAGALAYGMQVSQSEFFAIFDADFIPQANFLKQVMPVFDAPHVGMVQTRWTHLNHDVNVLTRAQSLAIDGHFTVEQMVRSRCNLLFSFNGSGGVWRRSCIESAGGWQSDTLAEDLDLSYRALFSGWEFRYCPQFGAPAEIPEHLMAFKRQQFRWAKGSIQTARKLLLPLVRSDVSWLAKLHGTLHLTGYIVHPMMILWILLSLPLSLTGVPTAIPLNLVGLAGIGPPLVYFIGQAVLYRKGWLRFAYFPFLLLLGTGIAVNNSHAIFEALRNRKPNEFLRTPKFNEAVADGDAYQLQVDWSMLVELAIALYAAIAIGVAAFNAPELIPVQILFGAGFLFVGGLGLLDAMRQWRWQRKQRRLSLQKSA